jgi:hypothetical protein
MLQVAIREQRESVPVPRMRVHQTTSFPRISSASRRYCEPGVVPNYDRGHGASYDLPLRPMVTRREHGATTGCEEALDALVL